MPRLLLTSPAGVSESIELKEHSTLGRAPDSTVVLQDPLASSRHAYVVRHEGKWCIRDLGSTNGTFVNDQRVELTDLAPGDRVRIGSTVFEFVVEPEVVVPRVKLDDHGLEAMIQSRVDAVAMESFLPSEQVKELDQLKQDYDKLRVANELNQAIGLETDIDVLLERILAEVFKLLPADRGTILMMNPETHQLEPRAAKHRDGSNDEIVLSKTVINEVFGTGAAVLSSDAMRDERFAGAQSIMSTGIRSTMSVPMIYRSQLYGVIHLDSVYARAAFSQKDLRILTGLAGQAARAIDNSYKAQELEKTAMARREFERLLPSEIVEQVMSGKVHLKRGGELRETAILFSDIRGFTSWTENREPEYIVSVLNDYFELMVDCVHRHKGTLDKFMGDGLMALFGAPISYGNDTENAVLCALDMLDGLATLNDKLRAFQDESVAIGIGINSGPVIAGYMGSSKSMEYTTIGDHVNLAARLCGIATSGQILVSEATRKAVEGKVEVRSLPPVMVKGKREPVAIAEVVGRRLRSEDTGRWDVGS